MDITERQRLEDEKERERAFLNAIANNAPSLLCLIDDKGVMTERGANIAFEDTLEYDPAEIGGQVFWETFVDPAEADEVREAVMGVAAGEAPVEHDNTWTTKSGRRLSVAWTCTPLPVMDERTLFLVTGLDITERKRVSEELRASRARLVRAEEMARRTLERNLHDGAQQRLVALSVSLRLLESRMEGDRDAALALLSGAQAELMQALGELRELARGIHPAVLTDRGLRAALETLAGRTPVPVELIAPDERLVADVEAAAYYVVAESLTNVAKYARATSARVCPAARRRAGRDRLRRRGGWGGSRERIRTPRSRRPGGRTRRNALGRQPDGQGDVDPSRDPTRRHPKYTRAMSNPPTGTVTFLFADVEGSTALQQSSGADYAAAVIVLRRLLREAVSTHGGWETDAVGDEYVAAFGDGRAAVDAAFTAQRALRDAAWPGDTPVRDADRPPRRDSRSRLRGLHRRRRGASLAHR